MNRVKAFYGANPLHLLALLASFALAGYAAVEASGGPAPVEMLIWFVAAIVGHDLVAFPLYALADRSVVAALRHLRPTRRRADTPAVPAVNYVRAPLLGSGLLLLIFLPVITRRGEASDRTASSLGEHAYFGHWLLISAVLFLASAVVYAAKLARSHRAGANVDASPANNHRLRPKPLRTTTTSGTSKETVVNVTTTHDPHGGGFPRLVFKLGDNHEALDLLPGVTTIGSAVDADLRLPGLREHHAEVRRDSNDEYTYVYLGPAGGSTVNGRQVGEKTLHTGDRIMLGSWTMSFTREEFADHGRPYGGRQGGEGAHQRPQNRPRTRGATAAGSDRNESDPGEYF